MRIIKFRGKDIETSEWVYGDLIQRIGYMPSIMFPYESNGKIKFAETAVKRETIGQYTGLKDKNGVDIYEGDILAKENERDKYVIVWNEYYSQFQGMWRKNPLTAVNIYSMISLGYKVIGNIHDNPELLKGE